jgi:hypothetical protein
MGVFTTNNPMAIDSNMHMSILNVILSYIERDMSLLNVHADLII